MRTPFVAGNWKMNNTRAQAEELLYDLLPRIKDVQEVDVAVCPPFTALESVAGLIAGTNAKLGAQNCYQEPSGAFTGEISVAMLKDLGCQFCIIGHSERRQFFGETNEGVNRKAKALHAAGIIPIICVGETLAQREAGETMAVVERQIRGAFEGMDAPLAKISVVAYEPVWAIGTGRTATPAQAQDVHAAIRALLTKLYDAATADAIRIQYGGSVKADNAAELFGQPDIDGGLIGGAALKAADFEAIIKAAQK